VVAELGGVSLQEINQLEIEFLHKLNFTINVEEEEYDVYRTAID